MFIHTVYFWVKADAPKGTQAALVRDCYDILAKIPSVRQLWAGAPVPSQRPVVDGSYSVGLTVVFDDASGHDIYGPHPLHDQFIAKHKPIWERIVVYDFDAQG